MADLDPKTRRAIGIAAIAALSGLAAWLTLTALNDHVTYFYGPSEIREKTRPGQIVRLGGLVAANTVIHDKDTIRFNVTDGNASIEVVYDGILPDLFREGQGVVTEGVLDDHVFQARSVLAKHDETYMPAEVANLLKEQGVWRGEEK